MPFVRPGATTIGPDIFLSDRSLLTNVALMGHEYIHVMQYAANAHQALNYAGDCLREPCGDSSMRSEAIAYLWSAWLDNYYYYDGPTERRPTEIWKTPTWDQIKAVGYSGWPPQR